MKINLDDIEKSEQTKEYIKKYNLKIKEIINMFEFKSMITYSDQNESFKFLQEDIYISKGNKISKRYSCNHIEELAAFLIFKDDNKIELDLTCMYS